MEPDILNKLFAEELGESEELINDYYATSSNNTWIV